MKNFLPDSKEWILTNIQNCNDIAEKYNNCSRDATHKNIWAGNYDVWYCEQDKIDSIEIPKHRMQELQELRLIEVKQINQYKEIIWTLTEEGKKLICAS